MIYYLVAQSFNILWFLLMPIAGTLLLRYCSKELIKTILIASSILFLPIFMGYNYTFPYFNELLFFIIGATSFARLLKEVKIQATVICTLILSFILFCLAGMATIAGTLTVQNQYEIGEYKIAYIKDQGFSGGALYTYTLSRYTQIPIFIKEIEIKEYNDNLHECKIDFIKAQIIFDKCEDKISKYH